MTEIHYLNETHILVFLVQLSILLLGAQLMGALFRRFGYPALAGEILTGILLGPTILGRLFPPIYEALFPRNIIQQNMLETVSWLGVLFLLLATGFEVNISSMWRQGKAAITVGTVGVIIPILIGVGVFYWFPSELWGAKANRLTFTLFMATAAAISAIPVIAKVLHDLEILKSDLGFTTLSAFVINDMLGWMVFTLVLGLAVEQEANVNTVFRIFFEITLFGTVCLTVGSKMVGAISIKIKRSSLPHPATNLSFIACLAMICGAITQWIGIHAIVGFFLAGIMAGNTSEISERTREIMSQMVYSIFVPLFFATIGLKIDFVANLNLYVVLIFTLVAIGSKFVGAWIGGMLAKMSKESALFIGIAHIPGGAMEIVLSLLALELELISEPVFVGIVFAALLSSVIVGPLLGWSIKRRRKVRIGDYLLRKAVVPNIEGKTRWDVIPELCEAAARAVNKDADLLIATVQKREEIMCTGLEKGLAIPHGRLKKLKKPIVAFGRSPLGIDWDAKDGLATHYVFLVLSSEDDEEIHVQILSAITHCMSNPRLQGKIMATDDAEDLFRLVKSELLHDKLNK
ncbi:MAG: cation:proton antiporter [Deltaproteobacteria bacterium]|nr:cation:proton antiporter [Deltaproteobacteria bacterium]